MQKLSNVNMEIDELEREKFKLKRQMQVVTKKITSSIVKNSLEFNRNVESYETIRREAEEMLEVIRELRKSMGESRRKCKASSMVLTREFKRELAAKLKEELEIIRTLHKAECKMRELIQVFLRRFFLKNNRLIREATFSLLSNFLWKFCSQ